MLKSSASVPKPIRVVVCGFKGVGKTSILEQLIYGHDPQRTTFHPTIEDVYNAQIDNERGSKERVQFFDTAGLDSSNYDVPRALMPFADVFVLVYAVNNRESFNLLELLKKDIEKNKEKKELHFLIIGNKADLPNRQIDSQQASNWAAREKVRLIELSSFNRRAVVDCFVQLIGRISVPPPKSTFSHLGRPKQARPLSILGGGGSNDVS